MANNETSFIPEQGGSYQYGARRSYGATFFAVFIVVIAIGATVGAWWLKKQEEKKVLAVAAQLELAEKDFNLGKIAEFSQLDKRLLLAREMFNNHSMPSLAIDYLAAHTVSSIKWKDFSYQRMAQGVQPSTKAGDPAAVGDVIVISGEANGYGALYQQLAHFRAQREILYTDLQSYRIDPRSGIVSISMKLTLRSSYATFATIRSTAIKPTPAVVPEIPQDTSASTTPEIVLPAATGTTQVSEPSSATSAPVIKPAQPILPTKSTVPPPPKAVVIPLPK